MMTFILGGLLLVFGLWFATFNPAAFGAVCLGVAIFAGLNDWKNKP